MLLQVLATRAQRVSLVRRRGPAIDRVAVVSVGSVVLISVLSAALALLEIIWQVPPRLNVHGQWGDTTGEASGLALCQHHRLTTVQWKTAEEVSTC